MFTTRGSLVAAVAAAAVCGVAHAQYGTPAPLCAAFWLETAMIATGWVLAMCAPVAIAWAVLALCWPRSFACKIPLDLHVCLYMLVWLFFCALAGMIGHYVYFHLNRFCDNLEALLVIVTLVIWPVLAALACAFLVKTAWALLLVCLLFFFHCCAFPVFVWVFSPQPVAIVASFGIAIVALLWLLAHIYNAAYYKGSKVKVVSTRQTDVVFGSSGGDDMM